MIFAIPDFEYQSQGCSSLVLFSNQTSLATTLGSRESVFGRFLSRESAQKTYRNLSRTFLEKIFCVTNLRFSMIFAISNFESQIQGFSSKSRELSSRCRIWDVYLQIDLSPRLFGAQRGNQTWLSSVHVIGIDCTPLNNSAGTGTNSSQRKLFF